MVPPPESGEAEISEETLHANPGKMTMTTITIVIVADYLKEGEQEKSVSGRETQSEQTRCGMHLVKPAKSNYLRAMM